MKAIALLVLMFLLGAVGGVGVTSMVISKRLQATFRENLRNPNRSSGPVDLMFNRLEKNLTKELDLTAAEQEAVGEELEQTRVQMRAVRTGIGRDVRRIGIGTVIRIGKRLPEEKRQKFREIARERLLPWGIDPLENR
ncbi:hypothetical protein JIN85_15820 [Luteolibacter pohnpeiensis]|uniref:Uncharacterized protein n=1 Tax=Luteolibacter pohnpeiensis TaxID=454153 RepID=A0A934S743_9BACT|nr:hypothetical protein [Luteolibacter pohnpeiensis]MBK1883886.1 hypothetical protein [Luteolibacter pohnpeiensis]